jgi:hypothetical protein
LVQEMQVPPSGHRVADITRQHASYLG